jgi:hypothetical protein
MFRVYYGKPQSKVSSTAYLDSANLSVQRGKNLVIFSHLPEVEVRNIVKKNASFDTSIGLCLEYAGSAEINEDNLRATMLKYALRGYDICFDIPALRSSDLAHVLKNFPRLYNISTHLVCNSKLDDFNKILCLASISIRVK